MNLSRLFGATMVAGAIAGGGATGASAGAAPAGGATTAAPGGTSDAVAGPARGEQASSPSAPVEHVPGLRSGPGATAGHAMAAAGVASQ